jgi:hypothetical protein
MTIERRIGDIAKVAMQAFVQAEHQSGHFATPAQFTQFFESHLHQPVIVIGRLGLFLPISSAGQPIMLLGRCTPGGVIGGLSQCVFATF